MSMKRNVTKWEIQNHSVESSFLISEKIKQNGHSKIFRFVQKKIIKTATLATDCTTHGNQFCGSWKSFHIPSYYISITFHHSKINSGVLEFGRKFTIMKMIPPHLSDARPSTRWQSGSKMGQAPLWTSSTPPSPEGTTAMVRRSDDQSSSIEKYDCGNLSPTSTHTQGLFISAHETQTEKYEQRW